MWKSLTSSKDTFFTSNNLRKTRKTRKNNHNVSVYDCARVFEVYMKSIKLLFWNHEFFSRQINSLVIYLVNALFSRNFCQKSAWEEMSVNSPVRFIKQVTTMNHYWFHEIFFKWVIFLPVMNSKVVLFGVGPNFRGTQYLMLSCRGSTSV